MADLPTRKHPRLKAYDYSSGGYYFVTINSNANKPVFSKINSNENNSTPTETVHLTPLGEIIEEQLLALPNRYNGLLIDSHVIMPNHLHAILIMPDTAAGASPRPTLMDIVGTLKSLTTRIYNIANGSNGHKVWQTSFYDRVLTTEKAYLEVLRYIEENPLKWQLDKYYTQP